MTWAMLVISLILSCASLVLSLKAILDLRWDRFLVTVEGRATALVGENNYSSMFLTVEITNVGRTPVTVTELNWTVSSDKNLKKDGFSSDAHPISSFESVFYWDSELPMIIQPNSSYTFKYDIKGEQAKPGLFGRAEATFIYRPKSPKNFTHASTRRHVYSELRPYPENKPSIPPNFEVQ